MLQSAVETRPSRRVTHDGHDSAVVTSDVLLPHFSLSRTTETWVMVLKMWRNCLMLKLAIS